MKIRDYLKKHSDLRYEFQENHKTGDPRLRNSLKIFFPVKGKASEREKELTSILKTNKITYCLIPEGKGIYFYFITPHFWENIA